MLIKIIIFINLSFIKQILIKSLKKVYKFILDKLSSMPLLRDNMRPFKSYAGTSGENAGECVDLAGSMRFNFSEKKYEHRKVKKYSDYRPR